MGDEAFLQTIRPSKASVLPGRSAFLSGLISDFTSANRSWSMRDLADELLRVLPPRSDAWKEVVSMKSVGDARSIIKVAWRVDPTWDVSYEDAADAISKFIEPHVRQGKIKFAKDFWKKKMGGDLHTEKVWAVKMNLRGANLARKDLRGFILDKANLEGANLQEAKIEQAAGANFSKTRAVKLNAVGADLRGAIFVSADMQDADLRNARVVGADFSNANLSGARLDVKKDDGPAFAGTRMDGSHVECAVFGGREEDAPWWSDRNPIFSGVPFGYSAYRFLGGTALTKKKIHPF